MKSLKVKPFVRRWCLRFAIAYCAVVAAGCLWIWFDTEDRGLTALVLYGPRWMASLPLALLIPLAIFARSWWCVYMVSAAALGMAFPLMGGRVAISTNFDPPPAYARYRVMTWNAGGVHSMAAFKKAQDEFHPDIILIQESPSNLTSADFPPNFKFIEGPGGLRLASVYPGRFQEGIGSDSLSLPGNAARFALDTPDGQITVYNVHLPTVRPGFEVAVHSKLANLSELRKVLPLQAKASNIVRDWMGSPAGKTVIAGDFNMPVESACYRRDWGVFQNSFSEAGNGWGGTKMTSWHRVRIDHVLYGAPFHCRNCFIGNDLGSDHRPLIADLTLED